MTDYQRAKRYKGQREVINEAEITRMHQSRKVSRRKRKTKEPSTLSEEVNGVTHPIDPIAKTGQVWAMADSLESCYLVG